MAAGRRRWALTGQELFLFLAARLRAGSTQLSSPREFSRPQIEAWIADDEEGMRRFQAGE